MKTKRAKDLIQFTQYTESTHPAICALADFAAQNPGLDPRNYVTSHSDDADGWRAYHSEARSIQKDWHRFKLALQRASDLGVTDAQAIEAAKGAFSGRLTWTTTHQCAVCGKLVESAEQPPISNCELPPHHGLGDLLKHIWNNPRKFWSYTTGQYFPTEYRKAAASVLEGAIHAVKAEKVQVGA